MQDLITRKEVIFDLTGNYLETLTLTGSLPNGVDVLDEEHLFTFNVSQNMGSKGLEFSINLAISDRSYKVIKKLWEKTIPFSMDDLSKLQEAISSKPFYSIDKQNQKIYIAKNDIDSYLVEVYDFTGKKLETISRNYLRTKFTAEELTSKPKIKFKTVTQAGSNVEKKEKL